MEKVRVTMEDIVEVRCSCGAQVSLGRLVSNGNFAIVHPQPACADFQNREAKEYLRWLTTLSKSQGNA